MYDQNLELLSVNKKKSAKISRSVKEKVSWVHQKVKKISSISIVGVKSVNLFQNLAKFNEETRELEAS